LQLLPDLVEVDGNPEEWDAAFDCFDRFGFVALFPPTDEANRKAWNRLAERLATAEMTRIIGVSRAELLAGRRNPSLWCAALQPDIVIFDESFVHYHVPWAAFTATKALYDHWNCRGYTTFHSTTFQPNSISAMHFLRCLDEDDPEFVSAVRNELGPIATKPAQRRRTFAQLYNPSLAKTIGSLSFDDDELTAAGHYVTIAGRRIFDGVAGIASSIRGHNPANFVREVSNSLSKDECRDAVRRRLAELTGLSDVVPAVSGASAVENALRLGLAAQFPRTHVLALKGGFGGKTMFALTGTARASYKEGLQPLYEDVTYVDPFSDDALARFESALNQHAVGVVQMELIQAVGGVRPVPERVARFLDEGRRRWGYALFVDEIQTGMHRTGPFTMCERYGIVPDLLTIGKGTSDMMFPFAVTLYSNAMRERLRDRAEDLLTSLESKADYEYGYRTLLNTLQFARENNAAEKVRAAGELFSNTLGRRLASCPAVAAIRVFGLLIGIELDTRRSFRKWFRKQAPFIYIANMLMHRSFPLLMGFCQYEPHVLKLTPPLSITADEIERVCATVAEVLNSPATGLLGPALGMVARAYVKGKWNGLVRRHAGYEPATS
jgi:acetylornithine/succinyldiaminopimelate/putrescine aminotransferase